MKMLSITQMNIIESQMIYYEDIEQLMFKIFICGFALFLLFVIIANLKFKKVKTIRDIKGNIKSQIIKLKIYNVFCFGLINSHYKINKNLVYYWLGSNYYSLSSETRSKCTKKRYLLESEKNMIKANKFNSAKTRNKIGLARIYNPSVCDGFIYKDSTMATNLYLEALETIGNNNYAPYYLYSEFALLLEKQRKYFKAACVYSFLCSVYPENEEYKIKLSECKVYCNEVECMMVDDVDGMQYDVFFKIINATTSNGRFPYITSFIVPNADVVFKNYKEDYNKYIVIYYYAHLLEKKKCYLASYICFNYVNSISNKKIEGLLIHAYIEKIEEIIERIEKKLTVEEKNIYETKITNNLEMMKKYYDENVMNVNNHAY